MSQLKIKFESSEDINSFLHIVNSYPYDMDLSKGRIIIDAKSVLGIMNLGFNNEVVLSIHTEECLELVEKLEKFAA